MYNLQLNFNAFCTAFALGGGKNPVALRDLEVGFTKLGPYLWGLWPGL